MPSPWRDNEVPDDVKKALKAVINKLCQRESDAKYKGKRKGKRKSKKAPRAEEPAAEVPVAAQVDHEHSYRQLCENYDQVMAFARKLKEDLVAVKLDRDACAAQRDRVAAALRVERAEWARENREWNQLMQQFFGNGPTPKYNGLNMHGDFGSR